MPEILTWTALPAFGVTLLIFGFAPPSLLRLILHMYPDGNVRRDELMAELRARPWRDRPLWIVEQLETAIAEGLCPRILAQLRRRPVADQPAQDPAAASDDDVPDAEYDRMVRLALGDSYSDRNGDVYMNFSGSHIIQIKYSAKCRDHRPRHYRLDPPTE